MIKCGVVETLKLRDGVEVDFRALNVIETLRMKNAVLETTTLKKRAGGGKNAPTFSIPDLSRVTEIALGGVVGWRGLADATGEPLKPAEGETAGECFMRNAPPDIAEKVADKILKASSVSPANKKK